MFLQRLLYVVLVDKNYNVDTGAYVWACERLKLSLLLPGAYPGIGQGGWGHFSKFSTSFAKMLIFISSAYSHGEVYIRMLLAYSVFL